MVSGWNNLGVSSPYVLVRITLIYLDVRTYGVEGGAYSRLVEREE